MQETKVTSNELDYRDREAFKTLRTNIEFSGDDMRTICVTSTTPNEGKSTVAFEIASSFAQNGMKTLIIDADLRKSVMCSRHKMKSLKYGLTNYLAGKSSFEQTLCVTDVPNFFMMAAGVKIIGAVLNKVNMSGKGVYGKYYGKYYGQYYGNYGYYGNE